MQDRGSFGVGRFGQVEEGNQRRETGFPVAAEPVPNGTGPDAEGARDDPATTAACDEGGKDGVQSHGALRARNVFSLTRTRIGVKAVTLGGRYHSSMHTVIEALRRTRQEKGWSTRELARRLGVSQAAISSWERGAREPTWEDVQRWAAELGVSVRTPDGPPSPGEEAAMLVESLEPDVAALLLAQLRAAAALKPRAAG
jgi:transcriptional regulator with XRE-family HTH domain